MGFMVVRLSDGEEEMERVASTSVLLPHVSESETYCATSNA